MYCIAIIGPFTCLEVPLALIDSLSKRGIITETCEEIKIIMYAMRGYSRFVKEIRLSSKCKLGSLGDLSKFRAFLKHDSNFQTFFVLRTNGVRNGCYTPIYEISFLLGKCKR